MEQLSSITSWIKSNPLIVLIGAVAGVVAPISSAVTQAGGVVTPVLKVLDLPDCLSYADVYRSAHSLFREEPGGMWREYPPDGGAVRYEFREVRRTRDYIEIRNLTARPDMQWETMLVRLPVCGGESTWSVGVPERWTNLFSVWQDGA